MTFISALLLWQLKGFISAVSQLKDIVMELKKDLEVSKKDVEFIEKSCEMRHEKENERFTRLEARVRDIENKK